MTAQTATPTYPCPAPRSDANARDDSSKHTLTDVCKLLRIASISDDGELRFARKRVRAGQWVYGAGEKFSAVYLVHIGSLKTVLLDEAGNEQILGFSLKGDVLGIDGLYGGHYASQAVALTDCDLIVIPFLELSALGHGSEELKNWLFHLISRELVREHALVGLLGTLSAEARVARFLVGLSNRYRELGYSPAEFNLPMTRQEIGSYLGLTLETVSRSLSALCEGGFISVHQRAIKLLNIEALRCMQKFSQSVNGTRQSRAGAARQATKLHKNVHAETHTHIHVHAAKPGTGNHSASIWAGLPQ